MHSRSTDGRRVGKLSLAMRLFLWALVCLTCALIILPGEVEASTACGDASALAASCASLPAGDRAPGVDDLCEKVEAHRKSVCDAVRGPCRAA